MTLIAHDPGHGIGVTRGGRRVVQTGTPARADANGDGVIDSRDTEAVVNMGIARSIVDGIPWVAHMLLRDGPVGPGYTRRAAMAAEAHATFVMAHHINSFPDARTHGMRVFYLPSDKLAGDVACVIARTAPAPLWHGGATPATSQHYPSVCNILSCYANVGLPAVLIEWGFATHPEDARALVDLRLRPSIVACAAAGIAHVMAATHKEIP
jgi:N-acetylmuramoyl-L-alanine amidase